MPVYTPAIDPHVTIYRDLKVLRALEEKTTPKERMLTLQRSFVWTIRQHLGYLLTENENVRHALGELKHDTAIVDAIARAELWIEELPRYRDQPPKFQIATDTVVLAGTDVRELARRALEAKPAEFATMGGE